MERETNIYQENLEGFLALAEELQLRGLTGTENKPVDTEEEPKQKPEAQNVEAKAEAPKGEAKAEAPKEETKTEEKK